MMQSQYAYGVWFAVIINVMLILFLLLDSLHRGENGNDVPWGFSQVF
jgi:heme exporter protein D